MIAKPGREEPCSHDRLLGLLDDALPLDEATATQSHLDGCPRCREALQELAGSGEWWDETRDMLRETTNHAPKTTTHSKPLSHSTGRSVERSQAQWIQPLLEPDESAGRLGRLGAYPVTEIIGQGGMGVVLRGIDVELNRPVAIKVLSPHLAGVGAARQRFMREAQAAAAIVHPNVIPIYGIETNEPLPYLVMPFVAGGNLQQRIDRDGAMELEEVLRIGVQVAEGLAAAHHHGVIHRDVKPANILVEATNGRVLISDFGLARALDDASLTVSGMIAGTPQYMSPEQARGESIDARSDLFSLGSLLYALATGRAPFRAESPLAVLRMISDQPARSVHEINERMPVWFSRLVEQLMTRSIDERVESAQAAATFIRDSLQHVRQPSLSALPTQLLQNQRLNSISRSRWLVIVCAALLLGISSWVFYGRGENRSRVPSASQPRSPVVANELIQPNHANNEVSPHPTTDLSWESMQWRQELSMLQDALSDLTQTIGQP